MLDVTIVPFTALDTDLNGSAYELSVTRTSRDFIMHTRKQGSVTGNIYHNGTTKGTNPKTFLLLTGSIVFAYRRVDKIADVHLVEVNQPSALIIKPKVAHKITALTDITLLECNSMMDIQRDRIMAAVDSLADIPVNLHHQQQSFHHSHKLTLAWDYGRHKHG